MIVLFILMGLSFVGIVVVFFLLKNEDKPSLRDLGTPQVPSAVPVKKPAFGEGLFTKPKKKDAGSPPVAVSNPSTVSREKKPSAFTGFLAKLKKEKKGPAGTVPSPSVTDFVEKSFVVYQDKPEAGLAAIQGTLSAAEEKKIEQEIDLAAQVEEWKVKYERLDKLFNEKSAALVKSEESVQNELNNRKEFNKLKDVLEKELKDAKDKARNLQVELNTAKTETEASKKRTVQLEEKIAKAEKDVLKKDDEIIDLNKRLKAATEAFPAVVAVPGPIPPQPAEPSAAAAPAVPEASVQSLVAAPEPAVPASESPAVLPPPPPTPEIEEKTAGKGQAPAKEDEFLKLRPDIFAAPNPPAATPEPEISENEPSEPKGPADKPASEGQVGQQDEQKKE